MKGIASEDTKRFILSHLEDDDLEIPTEFWCYHPNSQEEMCCFWHFIFFPFGGPERDGIYHPCYEYECKLLDSLARNKYIAIYKSTGLGITEFILLWVIWKSCVDEHFQNKEAIFITGPSVDLAKTLIERTKKLCRDKIPFVDNGSYGLNIQGSKIRCYPSNNIDSARGIPRVSAFFGDEAAFFKVKDDTQILRVGERYIGKSDSYVIWVSTAGDEETGFFWDIKEDSKSIYSKFELYESVGLKKDPITKTCIYSLAFIEEARKSESHAQEYLGRWGHNVGDIFNQEALDEITSEDYTWSETNTTMNRVGFCDPGFGTSRFGIVITELRKGLPIVIYAEDFERKAGTQMIALIGRLADRFHCNKWGCDKNNPEIIKDMRETLHLDTIGIAQREVGRKMTQHATTVVRKGKVKIHPDFKRLKNQMMTIKYGKNGQPKKTDANPFDIGDAFIGNLWLRKFGMGYVGIIYESGQASF